MTTKQELHALIDALPDDATEAAAAYLARLSDPFLRAWDSAPIDDEPTTPEEDAAAEAGWQDYLSGDWQTIEEVREELRRERG